jgi:hypothetical protein
MYHQATQAAAVNGTATTKRMGARNIGLAYQPGHDAASAVFFIM